MTLKTAVVTGGGTGIGRDISLLLASRGYKVYATGRNLEPLEVTAKMSVDGLIIPVQMDVSDPASIRRALTDIKSVDALVANAGICLQAALDDDNADEVWHNVMKTNVDGVWYLFRALHDRFTDNARAVIVSSGLGKLGRPAYGAYTASKHAVLGLAKCFSKELAERNITVNAVCPGWVETDMARRDLVRTAGIHGTTPEQEYAKAVENIPLHRFVQPDEVAALIGFLLSEEAGAITGQAYNISCGEFFA
ncbi:SDR family oxidoreductase [Myxococcota bacterium]|nr:SDR family oxidoreductase [Myxococcota bacterium]MBU1382754.1 SDR family oxidoreductase [Myxococcota bacterium]MBU1495614.1 SDR family oxidoreductase [Myxococcota bacterium]